MPLPPRASEGAPGHGFACGYIDESPRKEVKRVTAPPRFVSHGMLPRPRSLLTQGDGKPPSWGQRLEALKYVPPLLRLVYQTHRGYTVAILALRAIRSFVPLAVLWIGKLIIDGVIAAMRAHAAGQPLDWRYLGGLVLLELGIGVLGEVLARLSALLESLLGDLFSNRISVRLMQHAATLDIAQYEDAETYDHLERARRQTVGRIGLIALLLATGQDLITLASLGGVLLVQLPWLLALLVVAVLPSFLGETHYAALGYSLLFQWTPERRLLDYLRYAGASDEMAKEVKLFNLSDFLVGRYAGLSQQFYDANKRLAIKRNLVSTLLVTIGTLGYYAAYAVTIYLTVLGRFTVGALTFLAGSFRQSRDLIQRVLLSLSQVFEQSLYLSDLFTFFDVQPRVTSRPGARPVPVPIRRGFEFQDVGLRYPGSARWAVRRAAAWRSRSPAVWPTVTTRCWAAGSTAGWSCRAANGRKSRWGGPTCATPRYSSSTSPLRRSTPAPSMKCSCGSRSSPRAGWPC